MERQLDFFGGIAEQLSQGTPALDNAYYQPEVAGAERGAYLGALGLWSENKHF